MLITYGGVPSVILLLRSLLVLRTTWSPNILKVLASCANNVPLSVLCSDHAHLKETPRKLLILLQNVWTRPSKTGWFTYQVDFTDAQNVPTPPSTAQRARIILSLNTCQLTDLFVIFVKSFAPPEML